jgi:hypothetical protein
VRVNGCWVAQQFELNRTERAIDSPASSQLDIQWRCEGVPYDCSYSSWTPALRVSHDVSIPRGAVERSLVKGPELRRKDIEAVCCPVWVRADRNVTYFAVKWERTDGSQVSNGNSISEIRPICLFFSWLDAFLQGMDVITAEAYRFL